MQFVAPGPGRIGSLDVLIDAIPASRADVARHLGISLRTLKRYAADDSAPRCIKVALFAESDYGRNMVAVTYRNEADMLGGVADCLRRDNATLRARIGRLETIGDFGCANDPAHSPAGAPALPLAGVERVAQRR